MLIILYPLYTTLINIISRLSRLIISYISISIPTKNIKVLLILLSY